MLDIEKKELRVTGKVKFDTIRLRVDVERIRDAGGIVDPRYFHADRWGGFTCHYGKWKREQGLFDGEIEWDEEKVFRQFLDQFGLTEALWDAPLTRLDLCRDVKDERFDPESIVRMSGASFNQLNGWFCTIHADNYETAKRGRQEWVVYTKKRRAMKVGEGRVRFEYRMGDRDTILKQVGRGLVLSSLFISEVYGKLDGLYKDKWFEVFKDTNLHLRVGDELLPKLDENGKPIPVEWSHTVNEMEFDVMADSAKRVGKGKSKENRKFSSTQMEKVIAYQVFMAGAGNRWYKIFQRKWCIKITENMTPEEKKEAQIFNKAENKHIRQWRESMIDATDLYLELAKEKNLIGEPFFDMVHHLIEIGGQPVLKENKEDYEDFTQNIWDEMTPKEKRNYDMVEAMSKRASLRVV